MAGERGQVDRRRLLVEAGEELAERQLRVAVLTHHRGGDPLADGGQGVGVVEERRVGVAVGVDEAGRQDHPGGLDHRLVRRRPDLADLGDAVARDADAGAAGRAAGAVHHRRAGDHPGRRRRVGARAAPGRNPAAGGREKGQGERQGRRRASGGSARWGRQALYPRLQHRMPSASLPGPASREPSR